VKVNRVKIAVLAAVALIGLLVIPTFAACPPGTTDLSLPAALPNTCLPGGDYIINAPGTYCVPTTGIVTGAGGNLGGPANGGTGIIVNTQNVAIVGETCCAMLDSGSTIFPAISVTPAANNCTIHNFTIRALVAGARGIRVRASDCTIEGMQFLEGTVNNFGPLAIIDLVLGQDHLIQNNEFVLNTSAAPTVTSIIRLTGGQGVRVLNNLVSAPVAGGLYPDFFVENAFPSYNNAEIRGNRVNGAVEVFVGPGPAPVVPLAGNSFANSLIADNTATCDVGIHLGATTNSTVVQGNVITYGATGTVAFEPGFSWAVGLYDAGGSNNQYLNNTVVAADGAIAVAGTALWFLSSNAVVDGNMLDSRGRGVPFAFGHGISAVDRTFTPALAGATNATITNNTIRGTSDFGVGIAMWAAGNTNFLVENNTIRNCSRGGIIASDALPFPGPGPFGGGSNHTIKGNTITNTGINAPGPVPGPAFAGTGIVSNGNNQIESNTINDVKNGHGIATLGNNDHIVSNSITSVSGAFGSGIFVWTTAGNVLVDGNSVRNISGPSGEGIGVAAGNATITNNTVDTVWAGNGIMLLGSEIINPLSAFGTGPIPLGYTSAGNATIDGNVVANVHNGIGINLSDNDNNTVTNNSITNTGSDGILLIAAPNFSSMYDIMDTVISVTLGWGAGEFLLPANTGSSNNTVQGNTITNAGQNSADVAPVAGTITAAIGTASQRYAAIRAEGNVDNSLIDGNTVENAGSAAYAVGIDLLAGGGQAPDNNDVTNNTVSGFTTVAPGAGTSEGIRVLNGENNTVVGNTVTNSGNLQCGIDIRTTEELPVTDNTVIAMLKAGLCLWGGTPSNVLDVQGNTLTDNVHGIDMVTGAAEITNKNVVTGGAVGLYVDPMANATNFEVCGVCEDLGNCITACILCQNDGLGQLDARGNYWGLEPIQGATIFGNVDFSDALDACPGEPTPPADKTYTYGSAAGWYMVSVPLASGSASSIFGVTAYRWNCATEVYDIVSMIEPKLGYWVYLPANMSVTDTGDQVTTDVTIDISTAGWHQISTPWSYPKSAIQVIRSSGCCGTQTKSWADAVTAGWVRDDIYTYSAISTDYTMPTTISPWYGYWVRANVSGLSLKLLYASGTPVSASFAPMGPKALVVPADLPPMPPSPSVGADDLEFGNYPNPIVDVHTTTFTVKGAAAYLVGSLKVQIFDLSGRLVYEAEEAGTSLDWHTDSGYGEYLANGVYLYKLYALVNGEWVVSETKKLAILR